MDFELVASLRTWIQSTTEELAHGNSPARSAAILSELHEHVQDALHGAGIEIASPHLTSHRDGNRPALPDPYLPSDYQAPGFRLLPIGRPKLETPR